ncbi:thiol reductant ABC exporter subunit CydD [Microbacterium sp.]|uniref:thiol reductant ABC exporter subunit CydD n=1 Tax=Microbacterium sp. TaxID=51671 RepID=UPI0039E374AD
MARRRTTDAGRRPGASTRGRDGTDPGPAPRAAPVDPRLLRYATASRGFFAVAAAIVLAQSAVIVGFAWLVTRALVGAIDGEPLDRLWPLLAGAAGLLLARGALVVASETNAARGAAHVSLQLRARLVEAIGTLGPDWIGRRNAAALAVTAGHGLESLDAYFGRYLPQLVATIFTTPVVLIAIWVADPISGLTVLVTLPLIPLFMVLIGLATRTVQRRQFDTLRRLAARFADTVGGLGTLKVFGRQHRAADSIETVTRDYARETMTVLRVSFLSGFALEFLASLSVALVAVTIGLRLLEGELSLLIGLFVLLLAPEAYLPIRQVGVQFHAAAEGVAATDDLFAVLDEASARDPAPTPLSAKPPVCNDFRSETLQTGGFARRERDADRRPDGMRAATGLIVDGVRVRRGDALLPPVSLTVAPGELVLVEGPSGTGKSSVVAAILGFAEHEGRVSVDGDSDAAARRRRIAWTGQRPGLVAGTIADNVALGDGVPDPVRVADALRRAQAGGLDPAHVLGAAGAGLSGGQAQRVAVARALYRLDVLSERAGAPGILILDEPSSALDAETEAALWRQLRAVADGGAGALLISHRTSAREVADRIVRLKPAEVRG